MEIVVNIDLVIIHLSKQISQLYDIVISLTERVDRIEKYLCPECKDKNDTQ